MSHDEFLQGCINSAGHAEEPAERLYDCEVIVSVCVTLGEIAAKSRERAKEIALARAQNALQIKGKGIAVEWDAQVVEAGKA